MHLAAVFPPRKKIQKKGHWIHLAVTLPPREKGGRIRLCTIVCGKYLVHLGKQLVHHGNVGLHPVVVTTRASFFRRSSSFFAFFFLLHFLTRSLLFSASS